MSIKVKIGTWEGEYSVFQTDAPKVYDGFGTITLFKPGAGDDRVVAIQVPHIKWQTMRYSSGLCSWKEIPDMDNYAQERLLKRLAEDK